MDLYVCVAGIIEGWYYEMSGKSGFQKWGVKILGELDFGQKKAPRLRRAVDCLVDYRYRHTDNGYDNEGDEEWIGDCPE